LRNEQFEQPALESLVVFMGFPAVATGMPLVAVLMGTPIVLVVVVLVGMAVLVVVVHPE